MTNEESMRIAIQLAEKGAGCVNPNPLVGAVVVKAGRVIAQGYHEKYGGLHAERNALANCKEQSKGAAMYVTLEPCCHHGKTPPCTDAIIESGIEKVFVGALDPNPLVAGKGIQRLREAGIEVVTGVLEAECKKQNRVFFHYMQTNTPFVTMKYAMTMDGKIATSTGESRWITGAAARARVHQDRHRHSGIMVGIGTVISDNPMLTCRMPGGRNPVRIVCDTHLRISPECRLVATAKEVRTILATCCTDEPKRRPLEQAGCEIVTLPRKGTHLDLRLLMQALGRMEVDSILLEGGSALNFSALESGIVHQLQAYIAPKIFGGAEAKTAVGGSGFASIRDCVKLQNPTVSYLGDDILIESEVKHLCSQAL